MSDPQAWTLIGVFAAAILGGLTLVTTMLTRVIRAEIGGVRAEIGGLRGEVSARFGGLRGELAGQIGDLRGEVMGQIGDLRGEVAGLHTRFDSLERRVDNLDTDVQAITDRLWRKDTGA